MMFAVFVALRNCTIPMRVSANPAVVGAVVEKVPAAVKNTGAPSVPEPKAVSDELRANAPKLVTTMFWPALTAEPEEAIPIT